MTSNLKRVLGIDSESESDSHSDDERVKEPVSLFSGKVYNAPYLNSNKKQALRSIVCSSESSSSDSEPEEELLQVNEKINTRHELKFKNFEKFDDEIDKNVSLENSEELYPSKNLSYVNDAIPYQLNSVTDSFDNSTNKVTISESSIPASVTRYLYSYQIEGIEWLWTKYITHSGGILADEMGLGKTIQIICLLLAVYHKKGTNEDKKTIRIMRKRKYEDNLTASINIKPSLIVAPAGLLDNWEEEIVSWGHFSLLRSSNHLSVEDIVGQVQNGHVEILLISYEYMRNFIGDLEKLGFELIIYDEGHKLMNDKGQFNQAALRLRKSECRIILSGTPIQNKIEELGALISVITNGKFLGKREFKEHFVDPIKRGFRKKACPEAIDLAYKRQAELQVLLSNKYMLRRTKEDKLTLLGKKDKVILCELSPIQKELYTYILNLPDFDNARYHATECTCGSGKKRTECCVVYQIPYVREISSERVVEPKASIWRSMHPYDEPCERCPSCVSLKCIQVLTKIANHPSLLQVNNF